MLPAAIKMQAYRTTGANSRDFDPAEADERIYDEVKDGYKDENQQRVQHLDGKHEENTAIKWFHKSSIKLIKASLLKYNEDKVIAR